MALKMNCLFIGCNSKGKIPLLQMRHSRRANYPDCDKKESPDHRRCDSASKRKTRSSAAQENKHSKHDLSKLPDR